MPKSVSTVSDSASVLARSDDKMGTWRLRVLPPIITRRASRDSVINQLLNFSLPKSLCDIDPVVYETESTLHFFLTSVQAAKTSVVIANDDPFKMNLRLPCLALLFDTYEQFAEEENINEASQLHPFAALLTMAFRRGKQPEYYPCRIERESEICLTAAGPGFPMRAQLDFAFIYDNPSLRHPSFWPHITRSTLNDPKGLSLGTLWQAKTTTVTCLSLLLFPGEGKRNHHSYSKNQLICDLSTCLHQQESLGLTVGFERSGPDIRHEEDRRGDSYLRVPALPFCDLQSTAAARIPPILFIPLQARRVPTTWTPTSWRLSES